MKNDVGGALRAASEKIAVDASSISAEALRARTDTTLAARIMSAKNVGAFAYGPKSAAIIAANENGQLPTIAGVNMTDPAIPNVVSNPDGVGVLGVSTRFAATGVVGGALGPRSTGVRGEAKSGVGVRGIGTSSGVEGASSGSNGVVGTTTAGAVAGVYGFGGGDLTAGVRGESKSGPGVDASSSAGPGVRAKSQQAEGVLAEASAPNAAGVRARNDNKSGVGVDGGSNKGIAVRGLATSGTALYAEAFSGLAIDASNFSNTEPAIRSYAPASTAVDAFSFAAPGVNAIGKTGVAGASLFPPDANEPKTGAGVYGQGFAGSGVCGLTLTGAGVLGIGVPAFGAWAGVFRGNVFIDGLLFKAISLFSIDHPLDPERKVLNHAAVEAPEHKTFYDGEVLLNARGEATVRVPRWFSALNDVKALRYQLTAIGRAAPDLHIARELRGGVFVIAGGVPRQKVCWQVTGIRRDAVARANPVIVEQSKREARPAATKPSAADVRRAAAELKSAHAALEREGAARTRVIKSRRPAPAVKPVVFHRLERDARRARGTIEQAATLARKLR